MKKGRVLYARCTPKTLFVAVYADSPGLCVSAINHVSTNKQRDIFVGILVRKGGTEFSPSL